MNRIQIAFVNPPYLKNFSRTQRSPAVTKSGTLYYPMWLAYAAGLAEQHGHCIDLIDAPAEDLDCDAVYRRLATFAPRLVVVETSTPSIYHDVKFAAELKNRQVDCFVMLVGTHVSALPEESLALADSVDAVAIGEYDGTVAAVADCLAAGQPIEKVAGLCCRTAAGVVHTGPRPLLDDLDQLPMVSAVYRRFLNINNYFNPNALFPMVTLTTSRGCPHRCIFCVYPQTMMGHRLRLRSVASVVDEVEYVVRTFPAAKAIFFEDDTFPANKERCLAICAEIIARGITISWTANARVDVDQETLRMMKKAGCRCLCVGFESGNQDLLDAIKKRTTLEQAHRFMAAARQEGILVHGCFIVGLPGETRQSMEKTLAMAIALQPDAAQFYPVMVYPGTEAYRWYQQKGLITTFDFSKWLTPTGLHNTVVEGEHLAAGDLVAFCDRARREFYLRPAYLRYKLLQMIRNPQEIRRTVKSAKTFFQHLVRGSDAGA